MDYPMLSIERPESEIEAKYDNKSDKKITIEEQFELINKKFENLNNNINEKEKKISNLEEHIHRLENEVNSLKKDKKDLFEICDYLLGKQHPEKKENIEEENANIEYIFEKIGMNLNPLCIKEGGTIMLFKEEIKKYIDKNPNIDEVYLNLENKIFTSKDLLKFNKIKEEINSYIIHNLKEFQKFKDMKKKCVWISIEPEKLHSKVNNNIYYYKYRSKFYFYFEEEGKSFDINSLEEFKLNKEVKTEISKMYVAAIINCLKNIETLSLYWENIIEPKLFNSFDYTQLSEVFQNEHNKIQKNKELGAKYYVNLSLTVFEKLWKTTPENKIVNKQKFKTAVNEALEDFHTHATEISNYYLYYYSLCRYCKCRKCTKDKKTIELDLGYSFIFEVDFNKLTNDDEKKRKEISIYDLLNTTCKEKMACPESEEKIENFTVERKFYECPPYLIINTNNKTLGSCFKNNFNIDFSKFEVFELDESFCYEKPKKNFIIHYFAL